jgi:serine protease
MPSRERVAVTLLVAALAIFGADATVGGSPLTNRLIVKFYTPVDGISPPQVDAAQLERLNRRAGVTLKLHHAMSYHARIFTLPERVPAAVAAAIAARLAADPSVEYALPDRVKKPMFVPTDPLYYQQWNLSDDVVGVRLPAAWDLERGAPELVIALLDSGILTHADLDPTRSAPGYDFISDPDMANDGNGRDADPSDPGDWVAAGECSAGEPAEDSSWHGMQVASVIGAATDNGVYIAGVNHGSRLLMARVLGKCGGFTSDIVDAMRWAAGLQVPGVPDNLNPARVINLSLGGSGPCTRLEQDAIDEVNARGAVVVVAAGNGGGDAADQTPAGCRGVITVAATTYSGGRAAYTNTGSAVTLSAPGGDSTGYLLALSNTGPTRAEADTYVQVAGTSFSTAQVSGIAALMLSVNADLNPQQVHDILMHSARAFPDASCNTSLCGAGIVDAGSAVQEALVTTGNPDADGDGVEDVNDLCPGTPAGATVDLNGCSASQLDSGNHGGGGGGCVLGRSGGFDPLLPLLVFFATLWLIVRRRLGVRRCCRPSAPHAEIAQGGAEGVERADHGIADNHRVTQPVVEGGRLAEFEHQIGHQGGSDHHRQHREDDIGQKVGGADVPGLEELEEQHDHAKSDEDIAGHTAHVQAGDAHDQHVDDEEKGIGNLVVETHALLVAFDGDVFRHDSVLM